MKKLFIILTLCSPMLALASENCLTTSEAESVEEQLEIKTDVPSHLKGATIIVRRADGKETSVPAEKFKVVPREQQFIVTKTKQSSKTFCSAEANKNRLSLLVGNGPKEGLERSNKGSTVTVESRTGTIGGLQYQRDTGIKVFNLPVHGLGQVQSNESALLGLGVSY